MSDEHGPDCEPDIDPDDNCTAPFRSDFGTGVTNTADFYKYIVQRSCAFFQAVISGTAYIDNNGYSLGKSEFIECVNKRVACNLENYIHNCCPDCNNANTPSDKCSSKYMP